MAKKLPPHEEPLFQAALSTSDSLVVQLDSDWLLQSVAARRDTALELPPEIQALLDARFPERIPQ